MTQQVEPIIEFIIKTTPDKVATLQAVLNNSGFDFDPIQNMVSIDRDYDGESSSIPINFGHELADLALGINEFLKENNLKPPVPQNTEQLTLVEAHNLLDLATRKFLWTGYRVLLAWWYDTQECTWDQIVRQYPLLFEQESIQPTPLLSE